MEKDKTQVITATELKTNLGKYLDYVNEDNEVVVSKNGKKAIRITPYVTDIEQYFMVKENARDYQYGGKKVSYEEFMEIYEKSELRMEYINGEIIYYRHRALSIRIYLVIYMYFLEIISRENPAKSSTHLSMYTSGKKISSILM